MHKKRSKITDPRDTEKQTRALTILCNQRFVSLCAWTAFR